MERIAYIYTDFPEKFGIPRQSGLVKELKGKIVFEPKFRTADAVRGLESFNYIWLLWEFEGGTKENWSATVRPPRLGGNVHKGVFATRSPFRPNPIGLSSVKLEQIEITADGPILYVSGVDLRNKTPIYDIKPYLPYVDCHTDAVDGFAGEVKDYELDVHVPKELLDLVSAKKQAALIGVLKQDPRPSYHQDPEGVYGMTFGGYNVKFTVNNKCLYIQEIKPI